MNPEQTPPVDTTLPAPAAPASEEVQQKSFFAAFLLSMLLGVFGADRFYLGKIVTGVLKLLTLGGLGIWQLIDQILLLSNHTRTKQGGMLSGYDRYHKLAIAVFCAVWLVYVALSVGGAVLLDHASNGTSSDCSQSCSSASNAGQVPTGKGAIQTFSPPTANSKPQGITQGSDGNMWVAETNVNKIARVTPSGKITEYATPSPNSEPVDVAKGPDGNIWFAEGAGHASKLARITPSGVITEYPIPNVSTQASPEALTTGPDGNIWLCYNSDDAMITRFALNGQFTNFPVANLSSCDAIVRGADNNLWFNGTDGGSDAQSGTGLLYSMTTSGVVTAHVPTQNTDNQPAEIAASKDGIWYTEFNSSNLGFYSYTGKTKQLSWLRGNDVNMYDVSNADLTIDTHGNAWILGAVNNNYLFKVNLDNGAYAEYDLPQNDTFLVEVAPGPDDTIWYTDINASVIGVLRADKLGG